MAKAGEDLQRLVGAIERSAQSTENVVVDSPKRMRDKDTGKLREHDVVLTVKEGLHEFVIAIECRDRSRKLGVPAVEAFHTKCAKTGVNMGVMVSSTGFAMTAIQKAASLNIRCMSLDEATQFDWCLMSVLEHRTRELLEAAVTVYPQDEQEFGSIQLYFKDDELVDPIKLGLECLNKLPSELVAKGNGGDVLIHRFDIKNAPEFFIVDDAGRRSNLQRLLVHCKYRVHVVEVPLQFYSYTNAETNALGCDVAVASMNFGKISGKMMMVNKGEEGMQLSWVPDASVVKDQKQKSG